jgi:hypothetical protein
MPDSSSAEPILNGHASGPKEPHTIHTVPPQHTATEMADGTDQSGFVRTAATVGVIAVAAAVVEAALIPGIVVGVVAMLAPRYLPGISAGFQPAMRGTVRSAYKLGRKTKAAVAEAREHMQDIVAEVHAETLGGGTQAAPAAKPPAA